MRISQVLSALVRITSAKPVTAFTTIIYRYCIYVAPGFHGPVYAEVSCPQQHREEIRTESNIAYGHNRP